MNRLCVNLKVRGVMNLEKEYVTTLMTICVYRYNRLSEISHMASAYKEESDEISLIYCRAMATR